MFVCWLGKVEVVKKVDYMILNLDWFLMLLSMVNILLLDGMFICGCDVIFVLCGELLDFWNNDLYVEYSIYY